MGISVKIKQIVTRRFSHPWMAMVVYLPLGSILAVWAVCDPAMSALRFALLIVAGLLSWTLIEYFLHRHIFHWTELREPWNSIATGLHMAHHTSAKTADLIIAPPVASLAVGMVVYGLFALLAQSFTAAAVLEVGVFIGYLAYEWVHFMSHRFQPKSKIGKSLRRYHLQHHFRDEDLQFGVTSPLWDLVFGTYKPRAVRHSAPMTVTKM